MAIIQTGTQIFSGNNYSGAGSNFLGNLQSKFVIKPKSVAGIGGFVFDYESDAFALLQAEITDHWAEDNSAINDHVAIRPMRITLRGYAGELVINRAQDIIFANIDNLQNRLSTVPAYIGNYTAGALAKVQKTVTTVQNAANVIDQALARVNNFASMFAKSSPAVTKQEKGFKFLKAIMELRKPMWLDTPYGSYPDMIIEAVSFLQDESTKSWSDVSVTLKQIHTVKVDSTNLNKKANRNAMLTRDTVHQNLTSGTPSTPVIGTAGITPDLMNLPPLAIK